MREFTSKQSEAPEKRFQFKLDGEPFGVVMRSDGDSVLEWSELAASAAGDSVDMESPEGAAFTARFFKLMMEGPEYKRFRAHMKEKHSDPSILLEIMQALNEEMEDLVEESTERPTEQPSRSSGGRTARDERTLQIVSLPDGEVELLEAPDITGPTPEQGGAPARVKISDPDGDVEVLGKWQPGIPLADQVPARPTRTARRQQVQRRQRRRAG